MDENSRPRKQARLDTFLIQGSEPDKKHCIYIYICIIASNDNNQCMQFVCPYCGPGIDWNNKYSYSYTYSSMSQVVLVW